ncbi:hypothetical protein CDIK_3443 [Cucumispora dikerogammari]|nr:hypothetical protein CDIK_3443 [Cucumispora dikerogammari]
MILKRRVRKRNMEISFIPKINALTSIPLNDHFSELETKTMPVLEKKIIAECKNILKPKSVTKPKALVQIHDFIEKDFDLDYMEVCDESQLVCNENKLDNSLDKTPLIGFLLKLPNFKHFKVINKDRCLVDGKIYRMLSIKVEDSLISNIVDNQINVFGVCNIMNVIVKDA